MEIGESTKYLTLIQKNGKKGDFECEFGNIITEYISDVLRIKTLSCGCIRGRGNGKKQNPLYNTWVGMRERCLNPNTYQYRHYGGRGITICDRWLESFENFYEDMGDKPSPKHSIDRKDVDGPYGPENCFWKDKMEQAQNRTDTIFIEYEGERKTIREWSETTGIKIRTIKGRLKSGMSSYDIFNTPVKKSNKTENAKNLSQEQVISIYTDNRSQKQISSDFGCSILTVSRIQNKEWYQEITNNYEKETNIKEN